jgi:hypothetical protein
MTAAERAQSCLDRASEAELGELSSAAFWLMEAQTWAAIAVGEAVAEAVDRMGREIVARLEIGNRVR